MRCSEVWWVHYELSWVELRGKSLHNDNNNNNNNHNDDNHNDGNNKINNNNIVSEWYWHHRMVAKDIHKAIQVQVQVMQVCHTSYFILYIYIDIPHCTLYINYTLHIHVIQTHKHRNTLHKHTAHSIFYILYSTKTHLHRVLHIYHLEHSSHTSWPKHRQI